VGGAEAPRRKSGREVEVDVELSLSATEVIEHEEEAAAAAGESAATLVRTLLSFEGDGGDGERRSVSV
jgi:hypothetical protein